MVKYLLHHKTMHPATFYAKDVEDARVQVRKWLGLVAVSIPKEEFYLTVAKEKPRRRHAK